MVIPIVLVIAAFLSVVFGAGLLSLWNKTSHSRSLAVLYIIISAWSLFVGIFLFGSSQTVSAFLVPAYYAAAGLIPLSGLAFAMTYSPRRAGTRTASHRAIKMAAYTAIAVAAVVFCFWPNWLIEHIDIVDFSVGLGPVAYYIYVTYFSVMFLSATTLFATNMLRTKKAAVKLGLQKVLAAWLVGGGAGMIFNLFLPLFGNYELIWVGPLAVMLSMTVLASGLVTTVDYFSLSRVLARGLIYCLFVLLSVFSVFLVTMVASSVLEFAYRSDLERFAIVLLALTVLLPIVSVFFLVAKKVISKIDSDGYNEAEILSSMSLIAVKNYDARSFFKAVRHTLDRAFGVRQVDIIVFNEETAAHLTDGELEAVLLRVITGKRRNTIHREDVRNKSDQNTLLAYDIEVVTPIISAIDRKAIGALVLSPRKRRFDRNYGATLEKISATLSPFIQSVVFYEKITNFNEELRQKINQKTKELRESNKELMRLDEMRSELLQIASHNLRTPLTSILGYASMLNEGGAGRLTKSQGEYVGNIVKSARNMNRVLEDLMDASRMTAGVFMLNKENFNFAKVIDDEIASLSEIAAGRGRKLEYSRDRGAMRINGDSSRLRQAAMNLVDNAIFYGKDNIEVRLSRDSKTRRITFTVRDDGIGIPKEDQKKMFTKMFRASNAGRVRPDGTGIGLYVVKNIIEASGGKLIFESEEGKGSLFGFEIE